MVVMVVLEAVAMGQSHHPQGARDGASPGCENRTEEKHEGMAKDGAGEPGSESVQKGYIGSLSISGRLGVRNLP
jgi:hypothetical protein